jgi:hypothetical protein
VTQWTSIYLHGNVRAAGEAQVICVIEYRGVLGMNLHIHFKCLVLATFRCLLKGKREFTCRLICAPFCLTGFGFLLLKILSGGFGLCILFSDKVLYVIVIFLVHFL